MTNKIFTSIAIALLMGQAGMAQPAEEPEADNSPYRIVRVEVTPTKSVWELQRRPDQTRWFVDYNDVTTYEQGRPRLDRAPGSNREGLGRDQANPEGYISDPSPDRD